MPSAKRSKAAAKKSKSKKARSKKELRGQDNDGVEFVTGRRGLVDSMGDDEGSTSGSEVERDIGGGDGHDEGEGGGGGEDDEGTIKAEDKTITLSPNAGRTDNPLSSQQQDQKGRQTRRTHSRRMARPNLAPPPPAAESVIMQSLASSNTPYMKDLYKRREVIRRQAAGEPEPEPEPGAETEPDDAHTEEQGQAGFGQNIPPHLRILGQRRRNSRCTHGYDEVQRLQETFARDGPHPMANGTFMADMMRARGIGPKCQQGTCGDEESGSMMIPGMWNRGEDKGRSREESPGTARNEEFETPPNQQRREYKPVNDCSVIGQVCLECTPGVASRNGERCNPSPPSSLQDWFLKQGGSLHVAGKACNHPLAYMAQPDCTKFHIRVHTHDDIGMSDDLPTCDNCGKNFDLDAKTSPMEDDHAVPRQGQHPCDLHRPHIPIREMQPEVTAWLNNIPWLGASPSYAAILAIPPAYVDFDMDLSTLIELAEVIGHEDMSMTMPDPSILPQRPPAPLRGKCKNHNAAKRLAILIAHHRMKLETEVARIALGRASSLPGVDLDHTRLLGCAEHKDISVSCIELPLMGRKIFVLHCKEPGPLLAFPANLSNAKCPDDQWIIAASRMPFAPSSAKYLLREFANFQWQAYSFQDHDGCGECECTEAEDELERTFCPSPDQSSGSLDDGYRHGQKHKTLRHVRSYGHSSASRRSSPRSASSTESGDGPADSFGQGPIHWGNASLTRSETGPSSLSAPNGGGAEISTDGRMNNINVMHFNGENLWVHSTGDGNLGHLQAVMSVAMDVVGQRAMDGPFGQREREPERSRIEMIDTDPRPPVNDELPTINTANRQSTPPAGFAHPRPSFARKKIKRKPRATKAVERAEPSPSDQFKLKERLEQISQRRRIESNVHDRQRAARSPMADIDSEKQNYHAVYDLCQLMEDQGKIDALFAHDVPLLAPKSSEIPYNTCPNYYPVAAKYGGHLVKGFSVHDIYESRKQEIALKDWESAWRAHSKDRGLDMQRLHDTIMSTSPSFLGPSTRFVTQMVQALEGTDRTAIPTKALEMLVRTLASDRKVIQGLAHHLIKIISILDTAFEDGVLVKRGWISAERDRVKGIRDLQWRSILQGTLRNDLASQVKDGLVLMGHMKHLYMSRIFEGLEDLGSDSAASNYLSLLEAHGVPPEKATAMLLVIRDLEHNKVLYTQFLQGPAGCSDVEASVQHLPQFPARPFTFANVVECRSEAIESTKRIAYKHAERIVFGGSAAPSPRTPDDKLESVNKSPQASIVSPSGSQRRCPKPRAKFQLRGKLRRVYSKWLMLDSSKFGTFAPYVVLHLMELLLRYCNDVPAALRLMLNGDCGDLDEPSEEHLCGLTWADGEDMMIMGLVAQDMLQKVLDMKPQEKERISGPRFTLGRLKRVALCQDCGEEIRGRTCRPCADHRVQVRLAAMGGSDTDSSEDKSVSPVESVQPTTAGKMRQALISVSTHAQSPGLREVNSASIEHEHRESTTQISAGPESLSPTRPEDSSSGGRHLDDTRPVTSGEQHMEAGKAVTPALSPGNGGDGDMSDDNYAFSSAVQIPTRRMTRKRRNSAGVGQVISNRTPSGAKDQVFGNPIARVEAPQAVEQTITLEMEPQTSSWQIGSIDMTASKSAESCVTSYTDLDQPALRTPGPPRGIQCPEAPISIAGTITQEELEADLGIVFTPTAKPNLGALAGEQMDQLTLKFDIEASPRVETALIGRRITVGQLMAVPEDDQAICADLTTSIRRLRTQRSASFSAADSGHSQQHSPLVADHHPELSLATYSEYWDFFLGEWQERASANHVSTEPEAVELNLSQEGAPHEIIAPPGLRRSALPDAALEVSANSRVPQPPSTDLDVVTAEDPLAGDVLPTSRVVSVKVNLIPTPPTTPSDAPSAPAGLDSAQTSASSAAVVNAWDKIRQQREALQQERSEQQPQSQPPQRLFTAPSSRTQLAGLAGAKRRNSFASRQQGEPSRDTPAQSMDSASGIPGGPRPRGRRQLPEAAGQASGQEVTNAVGKDGSTGRRRGKGVPNGPQHLGDQSMQRSRGPAKSHPKDGDAATSAGPPADDGW